MKYYIGSISLGYAGTDETFLIEAKSQEEANNWAESVWWETMNSSGAVYYPYLEEAVESGGMTEEEAAEEESNALHGMVVYEEDYSAKEITKENLEEMIRDLQYNSHDYTEEKEKEIRASFK